MSQEKVDAYKKEKKNRAKIMKRKKIKKALAVFILSLGVGALIGIPLGKHIYKVQKEEAELNKTIKASEYETWFEKYWGENIDLGSNAVSKEDLQKMLDSATVSDASATDTDVAQ